MKVVILAGGLGARLSEETESKPKPMVEIGGWPILWHIMNIYAAAGHKEFVLALGYKGDVVKSYFLNYYYRRNNITVRLKDGDIRVHDGAHEDWTIHFVDTGLNTATGGRLRRLAPWIQGGPFMMTYGDGVSNVDLKGLLKFHRRQKKIATITAVRPPARFGGLSFKGDMVARFIEKPQIAEGWINGGFFVLEPEVLDYIDGDGVMFEQEPLERLVKDQELVAYRHNDFWQCMDTLRDVRLLESLWKTGKAPWKVWRG